MEIGHKRVRRFEMIAGHDEDARIAVLGVDEAVLGAGGFQCADAGGADAHAAVSLRPGPVDLLRSLGRDLIMLHVHLMLAHVFLLHRTEGAKADVQQHRHDFDPFLPDLLQQLRGEVQTGGRRGGAALFPGIDRLIALPILQAFVNVGRQGHLTQPIQNFLKNALIMETHQPRALRGTIHDFRPKQPVAEAAPGSRGQTAARAHQRFPKVFFQPLEQQNLHWHVGFFLFSQQPGRNDPGVVDHHHVARIQEPGQIVKVQVLHGMIRPIIHQQAAVIPGFDGGLSDQLFRKEIVKIRSLHHILICSCPSSADC